MKIGLSAAADADGLLPPLLLLLPAAAWAGKAPLPPAISESIMGSGDEGAEPGDGGLWGYPEHMEMVNYHKSVVKEKFFFKGVTFLFDSSFHQLGRPCPTCIPYFG